MRKKTLIASVIFLSLPLAEFFYFSGVYSSLSSEVPQTSLVAIYSGATDRLSGTLRVFENEKGVRFLCSGWDYTPLALKKILGSKAKGLIIEDKALTTDQNARYSAPLIRASGAKRVVLSLPWYHLPRALFLTRLYLMGSGIEVVPYPVIPLPPKWWSRDDFKMEFVKFWGSIWRVSLAFAGIENWPKPLSM